MDKMNVRTLKECMDYVEKKIKLCKAQLNTMENDDTFTDSDLWLLASTINSVLITQSKDIKASFDIAD